MLYGILGPTLILLSGILFSICIFWLVWGRGGFSEIFESRRDLFLFLMALHVIFSAFSFSLYYLLFLTPVLIFHIKSDSKIIVWMENKRINWGLIRMALLATMIAFNIHILMRALIY